MKLSKEYKSEAKSILQQNWKLLVPMALVFTLIPAFLQQEYPNSLLPILWSTVGGFFFVKTVLHTSRNNEPFPVTELFTEFDWQEFLTYWLTNFVTGLYLILWFFIPPMIFVKSCSYALVPFLALDNPGENPNKLITQSRKLMNGRKMNLFVFQLSFILWFVGIGLTFGLLALYVIPYLQIAMVLYYFDCLEKSE